MRPNKAKGGRFSHLALRIIYKLAMVLRLLNVNILRLCLKKWRVMQLVLEKMHKYDFIKFLGTAGARFVVSRQLRASGGIWFALGGEQILVDPGPGSLGHSYPFWHEYASRKTASVGP
ncbi:MAG TPA: hypothetical protein DCQ14_01645 [Firmicutes bacterium]|nr:hypothetical protein [Bacillota bacterium]